MIKTSAAFFLFSMLVISSFSTGASSQTKFVPRQVSSSSSFDGFYLGAARNYSFDSSFDYYFRGNLSSETLLTGDINSAFVGYNFLLNGWLLGAELAFSASSIARIGDPTFEFTTLTDLKFRAGHAFERVYFYGVAGISSAPWDNAYDSNFILSGPSIGIGADVLITDNVFIGAEYLARFLTGDSRTIAYIYKSTIQTISVRLGVKF